MSKENDTSIDEDDENEIIELMEKSREIYEKMRVDSDGDPREVFEEERASKQFIIYWDEDEDEIDARIGQHVEAFLTSLYKDYFLSKDWKTFKKLLVKLTREHMMEPDTYLCS